MTEQLHQYRVTPDRNEMVERLSPERQAEVFFKSAIAEGRGLSRVRFDEVDEAHAVGNQFAENQIERAKEVIGLEGLVLRAEGPGVRVANIDASSDGQGRIMIDFNAERPLLEPPVSSDIYGKFSGVVVLPREHEDGTHSSIPYFILQNQQSSTIPVSTQYGFPLAALTIQSRILVACDGTATVELPALESYRARSDAMAQVALRHHDKVDLRRAINGLNEAMHTERDEAFTPLNNVEYLRTIGQAMAIEAEKEDDRADSIAAAVCEVLGRGHAVGVAYRIGGERDGAERLEVQGVVVDVLPKNPYVAFIGPTLVLGCPDGKGGEALRHVPLEHIEAFQF